MFKKTVQIVLALLVAHISILVPIYAQSSNTSFEEPSLTVINDQDAAAKTSQALLSGLEQNERVLYELFNELNSADENDIICSTISAENAGTNHQVCEPVFLEEIRQEVDEEIAQSANIEIGFFARIRNTFQSPEKRAERVLREKAAVSVELLQQEMASLASVHPNLLAQLQTIGELQREYLQSVDSERRSGNYLMRQNDPSFSHSFRASGDNRPASATPWFSAPPPGYSQQVIHSGYRDQPQR
jgi:hypothetical protein